MHEQAPSRDRRSRLVIYALLLAVGVAGLLFPGLLRTTPAAEATETYTVLSRHGQGGRVFILYDGGGASDAQRQLTSILRQVLRSGSLVVAAAGSAAGAGEVERALRAEAATARRPYGAAVVNLGYREGSDPLEYLDAVAGNFARGAAGRDHAGADLSLFSVLDQFEDLGQATSLVAIAGSGALGVGSMYTVGRDHAVPMVIAASGDDASEAIRLWQEGRIEAALPSGRATSDYERAVDGGGSGARHATALTLGTLFILALIIWAYLGGFFGRRTAAIYAGGIEL